MDTLIKLVEARLGKKVTADDKNKMIFVFKRMDKSKLDKLSNRALREKVVSTICKELSKPSVDFHEWQFRTLVEGGDNLKNTAYDDDRVVIESIFGFKSLDDIKPKETNSYVLLDSKYKNTGYTGYVWEYVLNKGMVTGTFTSDVPIENITQIRLYKPTIPLDQDYTSFEHRSIGILIDEFKIQSMYIDTNLRAHWILKVTDKAITDGTQVCDFDDEEFVVNEYKFDKLGVLHKLTIRLHNMSEDIVFKHDSDTAVLSYGAVTTLTTSVPHLFTGSTYITVTGFTTGNINADASVIAAINSKHDILATVTGDNTLTIPINSTAVVPVLGLSVNVYFENRRILIPMEIKGTPFIPINNSIEDVSF